MKNLFLFSCFLACLSLPAQAEDPFEAMAFSQRLAKLVSWEEVAAAMNENLPRTFAKEFTAATTGAAFPTVRLQKRTLVIKAQGNSRKLYLTLGAKGEASLNGMPLGWNPLVPVSSELRRLSEFSVTRTPAHARLWSWIVTEARAAGGNDADAAFALGASSSWKAKSCADGSNDTPGQCAEAGAATLSDKEEQERYERAKKNAENFHTIGLKCAPENHGVTETISKSRSGRTLRKRITYAGGKPVHYTLEGSGGGKGYTKWMDFDPRKPDPNADINAVYEWKVADIDNLNQKICQGGPEMRARYDALMADNRQLMAAPDGEGISAPDGGGANAK